MPDDLKVLLTASDPERAAILEMRLSAFDVVVVHMCNGGGLPDLTAEPVPDIVVVDMVPLDRDRLDRLRRATAARALPVVMFVDRDDQAFMEEAIAAGVSSYTVTGAAFPDLKPIVMAAVALFRKHQLLANELSVTQAMLAERETINRAKLLLMRQRNIDEPRAYRWLRRKAMNESRRIGEIAAELINAESNALD